MLGALRRGWWRKLPPKRDERCYLKKTDALNALRAHNQRMIDEHLVDADSGDWDAIQVRYGGQVRDVYDAMDKSLSTRRRPYCLTDFDIDTFRETEAMQLAEDAGARFERPGRAQDYLNDRDQERGWIEAGIVDQCFTIKRRQRQLFKKAIVQRACICRGDRGRFVACATRRQSTPVVSTEVPF
jgi:hypothetical protein